MIEFIKTILSAIKLRLDKIDDTIPTKLSDLEIDMEVGGGASSWNDLTDKPFGEETNVLLTVEEPKLLFTRSGTPCLAHLTVDLTRLPKDKPFLYTLKVNNIVVDAGTMIYSGYPVCTYFPSPDPGMAEDYSILDVYADESITSKELTIFTFENVDGLELPVSLEFFEYELKKIDEKFLPEQSEQQSISWNDLEDRPFGEEKIVLYSVNGTDVEFSPNNNSMFSGARLYFDPSILPTDRPISYCLKFDNEVMAEGTCEYRDYPIFAFMISTDSEKYSWYIEDFTDYDSELEIESLYSNEQLTISTVTVEFYEDGIKKIDEKYLPESIGGSQPDWNQNDETAKDYIKNRPFYPIEGTYLVEPITLTFNAGSETPNESITVLGNLTSSEFQIQWGPYTYHGDLDWNRWGEVYEFTTDDDDCPIMDMNESLSTLRRKDTTLAETVTFAIGRPLPKYETIPQAYLPNLKGATAESAGSYGIVPTPPAGGQEYVLFGNGKWMPHIKVLDNTDTYDPKKNMATTIKIWELPTGLYMIRGYVNYEIKTSQDVIYNAFVLCSIYNDMNPLYGREVVIYEELMNREEYLVIEIDGSGYTSEYYYSRYLRLTDGTNNYRITIENGELKATQVT